MHKKVSECRCCGHDKLLRYLDLGNQPLANSYHKNEKDQLRAPLCVNLCVKCNHSQLSVVVDPEIMFTNYLYVSGTTATFREHCQDLADDALSYLGLKGKHEVSVLDIACNDGSQLAIFQSLGIKRVVGVDPAQNLRRYTEEKGISVEVGFWSKDVARVLNRKFDIVMGTNVFAHVDDALGFLEAAKLVLKSDGCILLEFPYSLRLVEQVAFDQIYHEHLSYFLVSSVLKLVERAGLKIRRVVETHIHGGSIRVFLSIQGEHCKRVWELMKAEEERGLYGVETYGEFSRNVDRNITELRSLLSSLSASGFKLLGYGASAKINTMLNYSGIDSLSYIVDDNPLKWEYLTPGCNIPIRSPECLRGEANCAILIGAWNFYDEIRKKIQSRRTTDKTDYLVLYVPKASSHRMDYEALSRSCS